MARKGGCGTNIVAILLLLAVVLGLGVLAERIDRARFPWGYASPGRSTLAGTWVGPVVTGSGQRIGMLIQMELAPLAAGRRRSTLFRTRRNRWLEGRALVCGAPGRVAHFEVDGKPEDTKRASRFRLSMSVADSVPVDGLAPSHVVGRWEGQDDITLSISLYLRRGESAITSSADPDTGPDQQATLKRGTEAEFAALCSRLGR
jgi:hypothetical protein